MGFMIICIFVGKEQVCGSCFFDAAPHTKGETTHHDATKKNMNDVHTHIWTRHRHELVSVTNLTAKHLTT